MAGAGLLEMASGVVQPATAEPPVLALRSPDLPTAARIATVINTAIGDGVARVLDAGAVQLNPGSVQADNLPTWLAAIDTLPVDGSTGGAQVVIDARSGMLVAGGDVPVGRAVVAVSGVTVRIGTDSTTVALPGGAAAMPAPATAQELATGLHELGMATADIAAVFEALRAAGAIRVPVTVR
jgi:flagellar P-ring protein precursor FlgI